MVQFSSPRPLFLCSITLQISGAAYGQYRTVYSVSSPADSASSVLAQGCGGDVDGDGQVDFVLGRPDDDTGGTDAGAAVIYSGATGIPIFSVVGASVGRQLGRSVTIGPDVSGDGRCDAFVAERGPSGFQPSIVRVFSGATGGLITVLSNGSASFGAALDASCDVTGDGVRDVLVGVNGTCVVYSGVSLQPVPHLNLPALNGGGELACYAGDVNRDGRVDIAVAGEDGFYSVISGLTGSEIRSDFLFLDIAALGSAGDVNGDGFDDLVFATAPDYWTCACQAKIAIVSGQSGQLHRVHSFSVATNSWQGAGCVGLGDINGDGYADYYGKIVGIAGGGAYSGATGLPLNGTGLSGIKVLSIGDLDGDGRAELLSGQALNTLSPGPWTYCAPKVNSRGCEPLSSFAGSVALSAGSSLQFGVSNVLSGNSGLLFGGVDAKISPFSGGWLCTTVAFRTLTQFSGGSVGTVDCSGVYSFEITPAFLLQKAVPVGTTISVQYWSRDSGFAYPLNTGLTGALRFVFQP